jgi:hypothetical protein
LAIPFFNVDQESSASEIFNNFAAELVLERRTRTRPNRESRTIAHPGGLLAFAYALPRCVMLFVCATINFYQ